jgi:HK97 family phage major capsid protein
MNSKPFSMMRLAVALRKRNNQEQDWRFAAPTELDLSNRLKKEYENKMGFAVGGELMPLATDLMPIESRTIVEKDSGREYVVPGLNVELVKECRDLTQGSLSGFDPRELDYLEKEGFGQIRKDMSANVTTTGGSLVAFASQGELIEMLRGVEVFARAGAQEIDLPPQGTIRFPRVTSGITIAAFAEAATVSESTPGTSHLLLSAKKYSGLVDIPEELMKFATSVAVEAWLRGEFTKDIGLKVDADQIAGAGGGTAIQGAINYSGARTVVATTTDTDGNTLEAQDPDRLFADIADQNAPVDSGFFFACTNTLWGGISNRRADAVSASDAAGPFVFNVGTQAVGGGKIRKTLNGNLVITSTQIPTNRTKGSGTTLTLLFGGVGREWLIARAGVIEFNMTNSDASKFTQGLSTMRGTMYMDAGPRHENSFGMIDTLLNS